jgi:hypothetical protein
MLKLPGFATITYLSLLTPNTWLPKNEVKPLSIAEKENLVNFKAE